MQLVRYSAISKTTVCNCCHIPCFLIVLNYVSESSGKMGKFKDIVVVAF